MRSTIGLTDEASLNNSPLFSNLVSDGITIELAAKELNVSTASVRNWIKTGYLVVSRGNTIDLDSFETFKTKVVGAEKLTKRANKSQYDKHDHTVLGKSLADTMGVFESVPLDELGDAYEQSLSNSYRNIEGIYYTPQAIAKSFFESIEFDVKESLFLDPCCGSGNFLVEALRFGFAPENIYGCDIDPLAIEIARRRISALVGDGRVNFYTADFLNDLPSEIKKIKYDVIFTNPPWGKKLPRDEKERVSGSIGVHKNTDTSGLFLALCLNLVKNSGIVGMLMPDAFFNVASFQSVREKVLTLNVLRMSDYGKPFKGVLSGAKSVIVQNVRTENSDVRCERGGACFIRKKETFSSNPKKIMNFNCNTEDANVIKFLMAQSHITLAEKADWGIGIVTGNNAKFTKPSWEPGYIAAYKGSDVYIDRLAEPSVFIPDDMSLYQQVAPERFYLSDEKLIYRFISSRLVFYHDRHRSYVLNSANVLIPHKGFPVEMALLARYLSSGIANWLFQSIFSTHKVLRADIEAIPIFLDALYGMSEFDESLLLERLGVKQINGTYIIK
jgi:site-specific DNA-methyltransferase (adenine-specific)